jgi:hypothetical protein
VVVQRHSAGQPASYRSITNPARTAISVRFRSEEERVVIADRLVGGQIIGVIAAELG